MLVYDGAEDVEAEAEWFDDEEVDDKCTTDGGYAKSGSACKFPFKFGCDV